MGWSTSKLFNYKHSGKALDMASIEDQVYLAWETHFNV